MDLILKNAKMPTSCSGCRFNNAVICTAKGSSIPKDIILRGGKASDCPFIELKTPHGDLVDVDEILNYAYEHGHTTVSVGLLATVGAVVPATENE